MAFVKLDTGMLNSTTWYDKPARDLFITALLLAQPKEYTEPVPQLNAHNLDQTGWHAPPGWYGFAPASGPGLAHLAHVQWDEAVQALGRLGSPEPESRSQEHDGRRLIRVDGGYLVLNFQRYRDKDHTTAQRSRRWREKQATSRCNAVSTRDTTQAEAEAYNLPSVDTPAPKPKLRHRDPNWYPARSPANLKWEKGANVEREWERFCDHHDKHASKFANWDAAWRTWLQKAPDFAAKNGPRQPEKSEWQRKQDEGEYAR